MIADVQYEMLTLDTCNENTMSGFVREESFPSAPIFQLRLKQQMHKETKLVNSINSNTREKERER